MPFTWRNSGLLEPYWDLTASLMAIIFPEMPLPPSKAALRGGGYADKLPG